MVTPEAINSIVENFNLNYDLSASEIVAAARNGDTSIAIKGGLKLQKSRVAGHQRLEIIGFTDKTQLDWLKSRGAFSEFINYRLRAFIPNDESAIDIVEKILAEASL
jgi:hypothetical protein